MALCTLGISHHTAPLAVRERVAIAAEDSNDALRQLSVVPGVQQAAILSTCNRTELYLHLETNDDPAPLAWLSNFRSIPRAELESYCYRHQDADAVRHVLRVATGLDSMVLGEPQILGQLKTAWRRAHDAGTLGAELERLLQHSFAVAKRIRTDTDIGTSPVSVAYAAVHLARQIFADLSEQTTMLVGAGDTVELVARHLAEQGCRRIIVANRSLDRAQTLASRFSGYAVALDDLPLHLEDADILISSTASPAPLITRDILEPVLKNRRRRPLFVVDLAVPRDVEPEVGELADVFLYSVDDLSDVIQQGMQQRRAAAQEAEAMIELEVEQFMSWLRAQQAVPAIRQYRGRAEQTRNEVLKKARDMLDKGADPEQALDYLAHTLTRRLIHEPSVSLRRAAAESDDEVLAKVAWLLGTRNKQDKD